MITVAHVIRMAREHPASAEFLALTGLAAALALFRLLAPFQAVLAS